MEPSSSVSSESQIRKLNEATQKNQDQDETISPSPEPEETRRNVQQEDHDAWGLFSPLSLIFRAISSASVEPTALFMMTAVLNSYVIFQNVLIHNICRVSRNHTEEVCLEIVKVNASYAEEEVEIQKILAETKIIRSVIDHTFPILFVLFMGPWSDHYGRKIPLLLPIFGFFMQNIMYLVLSMFYDRIDPHVMNIVVALPRSLTGGETAFTMAAYSYICDITANHQRTVRTGILNSFYLGGVPLGFALAGVLVQYNLSYVSCFAISSTLLFIGLLLILLRTKNTTKSDRLALEGQGQGHRTLEEPLDEPSSKKSFWEVINPRNNLYLVLSLPFLPRPQGRRVLLLLLLLTFVLSAAPIHGEFTVVYMFVRSRLTWSAVEYGRFSTFSSIIAVIGGILSMGVLSRFLNFSDPLVGFISGLSQMGGCFLYAFAQSGWVLYLASSVDMMNSTMVVIARSMMSKVVEKSEVGGLMSLIALLESLIPLGMDPLYNAIYRFTVDWFSGAFYIFSAILTVPPQIVYFWCIFSKEKDLFKGTRTSEDRDNDKPEITKKDKESRSEQCHDNLAYTNENEKNEP